MKRKDAGLTTVEIVVAAVILVAVVVGLLLVVKLSKNSDGPSKDEEEAKKIVSELLSQVDTDVRSADLDVTYDADNYIRFIGRNKCQFFLFDSASGNVYLLEKDSSEFGKDDDSIRNAAAEAKPTKEEMKVTASNVKTFIIELVNPDTAEGKVKTTVRVQVGTELVGNVSESRETPLHSDAIKYFADRAGHDVEVPSVTPTPIPTNTATPTPTPEQQPGDNTPTPEPTKPADTPTPEATPTEAAKELVVVHKVTNPQSNASAIAINTMIPPIYPEDAAFVVIAKRTAEETENKKGSTIGGIGLDIGTPADGYTFVLDRDYAVDEEIRFTYTIGEFWNIQKVSDIKKLMVKIDDNSGYTLVGVDIEYYK
ncbi:MAG: hypothetical protein J6Y10_03415 [Lachnospiraceae bacterium]|nr:hypothetical protein [Lachnospiraceae bacterium]